ncbi:MAG: hypothetical protein ACOH2J_16570 [Allorhizobium sp.]
MSVARYADYIAELRALFAELDQRPELFQTFDVRMEMVAGGNLVVYKTQRRKGLTDSLYYARSGATGQNQQRSQAFAFSAIDRFFALGQFAALTGLTESRSTPQAETVDAQYPHCAVNFSYRKKGHPVARSMLMVFMGFTDESDALQFFAGADEPSRFVSERPYQTAKAYEWK